MPGSTRVCGSTSEAKTRAMAEVADAPRGGRPLGALVGSSPIAPERSMPAAPAIGLDALRHGRAWRPTEGFWLASVKRLLRNRVAMAALTGIVIMVVMAFAAPLI